MEYVPISCNQSRCLTLLKGVAIFLVILIHSDTRAAMNVEAYSLIDVYLYAITREIAFDAVPLFFFISGYLFFLKEESFAIKWKKRLRSIVLPYFIWCIIAFLIPFMIQNVFGLSSLYQGRMKLISEFEPLDYLRMFWNIRDGGPILSTLWFLKSLMVLVAFTPIIALLIRYMGVFFPILLFLNYVFFKLSFLNFLYIGSGNLFFFGLGCWLSKKYSGAGLLYLDRMKIPWIACCWLVSFFCVVYFYATGSFDSRIHDLFMIVDCLFMYKIVQFLSRKYELKFLIKLSQASFFIYLFHEPWMGYAVKLFFKFFRLEGFLAYIFPWVLCLTTIMCSYVVYLGLKRFVPRLLSVAVGSR